MCMLVPLVLATFGDAVRAEPDKREVGEAGLVSKLFAHARANLVELLAGDRANGVAGLADQVLVLGGGKRVQARPVPEMDMPDEPDLL